FEPAHCYCLLKTVPAHSPPGEDKNINQVMGYPLFPFKITLINGPVISEEPGAFNGRSSVHQNSFVKEQYIRKCGSVHQIMVGIGRFHPLLPRRRYNSNTGNITIGSGKNKIKPPIASGQSSVSKIQGVVRY